MRYSLGFRLYRRIRLLAGIIFLTLITKKMVHSTAEEQPLGAATPSFQLTTLFLPAYGIRIYLLTRFAWR